MSRASELTESLKQYINETIALTDEQLNEVINLIEARLEMAKDDFEKAGKGEITEKPSVPDTSKFRAVSSDICEIAHDVNISGGQYFLDRKFNTLLKVGTANLENIGGYNALVELRDEIINLIQYKYPDTVVSKGDFLLENGHLYVESEYHSGWCFVGYRIRTV